MYDSTLSTAKYLTQPDEPDETALDGESPVSSAPPAAGGFASLEKMS